MLDRVLTSPAAITASESSLLGMDLAADITRLKKDKNAVILAHYYQDSALQDVADFVGDSLELSRKAAATDADVIVFCGVRFMAETAKILSPSKTVLLPDLNAGCTLEASCPIDDFRAWRARHPDHVCLTYINCSAEVKAASDIIVTSANAEHIIHQMPDDQPLLFAPDRFLGGYLNRKTGRNMVLWPGTCIVHEQFSAREIAKLKAHHPHAEFIAHPECPEDVLALAEYVGSTSALLRHVTQSPTRDFIIGTESGIVHQMRLAVPDKNFIVAPYADGQCNCASCPYMKLNSMEKLYLCLHHGTPEIHLDETVRQGAHAALRRMLDLSPPTPVLSTPTPPVHAHP